VSARLTLSALSAAVARLDVQGNHGWQLISSAVPGNQAAPRVYALGAFGEPRVRLTAPWSPTDDDWTLETLRAKGVSGAVPEEAELAYLAFAEGTAAENSAHVLGALPDGEYRVVRVRPPSSRSRQVTLGNQRMDARPNALELLDTKDAYACAWGRGSEAPPSGRTPLVGLGMAHFDGSTNRPGLLAFELGDPGTVRTMNAASQDLVVVVPVRGPLVIDVLDGFGAGPVAEAWATTHAESMVRCLSGA
jgi:hypothetical protein